MPPLKLREKRSMHRLQNRFQGGNALGDKGGNALGDKGAT
jgi:hypothetical protein